jgi:hypothetical protein
MDEGAKFDRVAVRRMVEDHWRLLMLAARDINKQHPYDDRAAAAALSVAGQQLTSRFDEQCRATAALMSPEQAQGTASKAYQRRRRRSRYTKRHS